jgi:hypothetical protein
VIRGANGKERLYTPAEKERASMSEERESLLPNGRFAYSPPTYRRITGLLPGGRRLTRPLTVAVEHDDGEVIVSEPLFHMHAAAPTEAEALEAFKRIFSGYLDSLTRREKTLGPQLRDQLNYLRSIIVSE